MKTKLFLMAMLLSFLLPVSANANPVNLNIKDLSLHDAVMLIANAGGINVSLNFDEKDSNNDRITLSLNDIEAVDAIKIIAQTKDLKLIYENNTYILTNNHDNVAIMSTFVLPVRYGDIEELRKAVVLSLDSKKNSDDDIEMFRLFFRSNNSENNELTKGIYEKLSEWIDYTQKDKNNKRVTVNRDTNSIILYGTITEYERTLKILKILDIPLKQVSLEAKVIAINKSASKDLGVEWSWSTFPQQPTRRIEYHEMGDRVYRTEEYTRQINDSTGYGSVKFGHGADGIPYEWYFGAKINALVTNGKAKILSRPNITTIQGREAIIQIGNQIPIPTTATTNSTVTNSYEYRDAGIILRCNPHINEDGSIMVNVYTEVSTPQYIPDMKVYSFNTRTAVTNVTLKDGEPMVIGGLIGKEEERAVSKIPFLGDLPILGALFRNHKKSNSESELMIFLTAHVIN